MEQNESFSCKVQWKQVRSPFEARGLPPDYFLYLLVIFAELVQKNHNVQGE